MNILSDDIRFSGKFLNWWLYSVESTLMLGFGLRDFFSRNFENGVSATSKFEFRASLESIQMEHSGFVDLFWALVVKLVARDIDTRWWISISALVVNFEVRISGFSGELWGPNFGLFSNFVALNALFSKRMRSKLPLLDENLQNFHSHPNSVIR